MKKKSLSLLLLMLPLIVMAAPVTQEQAMQKAREFMTSHQNMAKGKMLKAARTPLKLKSAEAEAGYYVFNVGEQQGYVVVSGDDRTIPILGYSTTGTFDAATIPANMRAWLEDYERQISMLDKYAAAKAPDTDHEAIAPLIKSTWDQMKPYNLLCPTDPSTGELSLTCCVATAVAQVMNYYKYPETTRITIPAYTTESLGIRVPSIPKTTIDWDNMLDSYDESATEEQQNAVATLMKLCGAALEVDYTSYNSSAYFYKQVTALTKYFNYDKSMRFLERFYFRAAEWDELIYNELKEQRPVLYGGQSMGGGHGFVIDGYSSDGYFHVNWGWSGASDDYFLLSVLDPYSNEESGASTTPDGYDFYQNAVVGIQKPGGETPVETTRLQTGYLCVESDERVFERESDGTFLLPIYIYMMNISATTRTYDIGCGVFNDSDEMVEVVSIISGRSMAYNAEIWNSVNKRMFKQLPDGDYTIKAVSKVRGSNVWEEGIGSYGMHIDATVADDQLTVRNSFDFDISGTIETTAQQPSIDDNSVPIRITLTNNGPNFNQVVFLEVNGKQVGGTQIEAEAGATVTANMKYKPTRSGINNVRLVFQNRVLAEGGIFVMGSESPQLQFGFDVKDLRPNGTIPHTNVEAKIFIHNNSRNAYNNQIFLAVSRWSREEEKWIVANSKLIDLTLEGDGDSVVEALFEGLDNNTFYYLDPYFVNAEGVMTMNQTDYIGFTTNEPADGKEDMTYMIVNPDFEMGDYGWMVDASSGGNVRAGGTSANICFEAWNNSQFDIHQTLTGLPAGIYEIQVQGFYRNRRDANAWKAYQEGGINVPVYVYLNNSATPLKNVFDEPAQPGFYSGDFYASPTGLYFPNDMATSAQAFSADMYRQSAYGLIMSESDEVSIGVKGATNQNNDSWAIWDNFRLLYLGFDPQYVRPALEQAIATANGLCDQMMSKTAYNNLTAVIALAEEAAQSTDGERMFQILNQLYTSSDEAVASTMEFQLLTKALDDLKWALSHYHVASADVQQQGADMLALLTATALAHQYEQEDVYNLIPQINEQIFLLRIPEKMELATANAPVECTSLLNNPSFERDGENTVDGWYGQGYFNYGNDEYQRQALAIEVFQNNLTLYQPIYNIPNGYYGMQVSAFYRYGTADQDAAYNQQGEQPQHVVIFMDDPNGNAYVSEPVVLMSSEASAERISMGEELINREGLYVPNDMVSAVDYFRHGHYMNHLLYNVTQNSLIVGFAKNMTIENDWLIIDNFRLFYFGADNPEEVVGIETIHASSPTATEYFDLSGRRLPARHKGFAISRQVQPDGTVIVRKVIK